MTSELPEELLDRSPEEASRRLTLHFLDGAREQAERLEGAGDEEALHDFRVAVRRLRSCLKAWRRPLGKAVRSKDRKALDQLQSATNPARDAEVALEWLRSLGVGLAHEELYGLAWFQRRFERRVSEGLVRIRERVLEEFARVARSLGKRLGMLQVELLLLDRGGSQSFAALMASRIRRHAGDLDRALERVGSVEDEDEVHELRIAAKRLRYLIEPFEELVPRAGALLRQVRRLQDLLGELNDAYVLGEEVAVSHEGQLELDEEPGAHDARPGLLAITRLNRRRRDRCFEQLHRDWLPERTVGEGGTTVRVKPETRSLLASIEELAMALENRKRPDIEIERKYLLRGLPEGCEKWPAQEIEQGWLPGKTLQERIRRVRHEGGERYLRTVKLGRGVRRIEVEEESTAELFAVLWPLTEGCRVLKRRYQVPGAEPDQSWLVDVFHDRELVLAEVEMRDESVVPDMPASLREVLDREVTDEDAFTNRNLAR